MSAAEQPIKRFIAITAGATDYPSGRLFIVYATVAGDVVLRMWGGGTHTINVAAGYSAFPYAVVGVTTSGTTATATYANGI
jgi:hypothetical protein